jgi:dephospho-CoA kinase
MSKKIGLTGEMSSGKTVLSSIFESRGVPVYNCDNGSKQLVISNSNLIQKIKSEFGETIYDGNIFKNLAKIVFAENAEEKLKTLTALIAPYINADIDLFFDMNDDKKFCLIESAILFETDLHKKVDDILYVVVPENIRIKRAIERDGITEKDYKIRMKNQLSWIDKVRRSTFTIHNIDFEVAKETIEYIYNYYNASN